MTGEILTSYTSVSSVSAQDEEIGFVDNPKEHILSEAAKAKAMQDDKPNTRKNRLTKQHLRTIVYTVVGFVAVIVVAAAVYFGVQFSAKRTKTGMSRQHQIIHDIITTSVFDKTTLLNELSPQYLARQWMILNDTYSVTLYKSVNAQQNHQNKKKIIQRFALAVFYYSMNLSNTNWMDTIDSECVRNINGTATWDGLNCNSEDELVALWLGKQSHDLKE
jgi:hypothetical protein